MSSRKRYRPRMVATNPLAIALHRAAKPCKADREEVLDAMRTACRALMQGVAQERHWCIAAGSVDVAIAIERQGIVRGLQEHLNNADQVLKAIWKRAARPAAWITPVLTFAETDALQTFADLHAYQVEQLSRGEFLNAINSAQGRIRASGQHVTIENETTGVAA